MMMALVFGWGLFCFFLVTFGGRLLARIAGLSSNKDLRELLLQGDQALAALMIGGSVVLVLAVYIFHKYPRFFLGSLPVSFSFANASWAPLHDVAFVMKYLTLVFLGVYLVLSLYPNFWRILATSYVRLFLVFTAWIAVVCFFVGGRFEDVWYAGVVACFVLSFSVFFLYEFNNRFGLKEFLNVLSWGAVIAVMIHWTAPAFSEEYIVNGRFQSYYDRATGFSVTLTPLIIVLFWRAMTEKDVQLKTFFTIVSLAGMLLILWSGSRSPIAATLVGGGLLWLRFRSTVFLSMFILAGTGIAIQLLFQIGSGIETDEITSRLQNAETGRFELWVQYFAIALESPIYGYGPSGLGFALAGSDIGSYLAGLGATEVEYEAVHNAYLAIFMRFGGIGFALYISLLVFAFYRAKQVLFSLRVPDHEKALIVLPATLLVAISFTLIFEDAVPGTGKGTLESFILFSSMFICQVYGTRLLNVYERPQARLADLPTMNDLHVSVQSLE